MNGQQFGISSIIIMLLITFFYRGYKSGMIRYLIPLLTLVCSLLSVRVISPGVKNMIMDNKKVSQTIESGIINGYESIKKDNENKETKSNSFISLLPDGKLKKYIQSTNSLEDKLFHYSSTFVLQMAMKIIVFGCSIIIMGLIFRLLFSSLNIVAKTPVISVFNKWGGGFISVLEKILVVWIIMAVMIIFADTKIASSLFLFINNNIILKWIYNINPLIRLL